MKEGLIFENEMMMVIEGNREATTSRDALVELINFCEEELNFETFIIAIPRKRHDHREFGKHWLTNLCRLRIHSRPDHIQYRFCYYSNSSDQILLKGPKNIYIMSKIQHKAIL